MDYYDILGVRVSAVSLETAVPFLLGMAREKRKGYVCVAPVSTIVEAHQDPAYRAVVNAAAMVTPDGMPVVWLGRQAGFRGTARTYGPDLMLAVCRAGEAEGLRHFFYGATEDICDRLEHNLKTRFPAILVAGKISPPYMKRAEPLSPDIVRIINEARPDVLWVGLGSPKQDFWMSLNREVLDVPVMVGVGAAFDFHAGVKPQAPFWMQRAGLEWLFRLLCEPRRLWKRYLVGNALFIWWLVKDGLFKSRK